MKWTSIAVITIVSLAMNAAADQNMSPTQPVRTVFERHDQTGVSGKEIVIGSAMLPASTAIGYHTHPGDEAGYVLKGTLILKVRGKPDRTLKAGDSFFNPLGAVHSLVAAPGEEGGTALSAWIIDKGKPLATAVP